MVFQCSRAGLTLLLSLIQHIGLPVQLWPLWWLVCCLEVVVLAAFSTLLSICRALLGRIPHTATLALVTMEPHMPASVSSARWHQNLLPPWYYLACSFVPFAPPLCRLKFTLTNGFCFLELWLVLICHQSPSFSLSMSCSVNNLFALCIHTWPLLFAACPSMSKQTHCFFRDVLAL